MGKVGRWVTDPKAGAYCTISLESGLTIERMKFFGFSSERVFTCNLDAPDGRIALAFLTREATPQSIDATPLGAFVKYLKTGQSVDDVTSRCTSLMAIR